MTLLDGTLEVLNLLALATGVAYAVLAARRNRLCWIAGAVSSICAGFLFAAGKLPMLAALQVFYVGMSVYGWLSWRHISSGGELTVGVWPAAWHLGAALVLATGVAYAVLAARRNRLCWIAGAVSSACAAALFGLNKLPMQAGLQVFYVAMSVYGWWSWKRSAGEGELPVGLWPLRWHLAAARAHQETAIDLAAAHELL